MENSSLTLKPIEATHESFEKYGQLIEPSDDGDVFGRHDAQLELSHGVPRFYIMHLEKRPLQFGTITHHARVTQCLGAIGAREWYLAVAEPTILDNDDATTEGARRSQCGHLYTPPAIDNVRVFRISGARFVMLRRATWHAGPMFIGHSMDFYNLELTNTNVVDHTVHDFGKENGVIFVVST